MKEFLRKILPASAWSFLSWTKRQIIAPFRYIYLRLVLGLNLSLPLKKKLRKIHFEIHLAEHCNLNCAGCNHFSSIAEPELLNLEEFTRDIERMGELFNHDCDGITLIGGEPLLNPDIIKFMKTARTNFPSARITIYTNGILLPQKDLDFWTACRDNNVGIIISSYPIQLDVETIEEATKKFGINLSWVAARQRTINDVFTISPIDLSGSGDIRRSFAFCSQANSCITLKHGKLFTCVFAAHVHHFSKKFGVEIPITEADYIDIYKESDGDTILEKLTRPIPACRFCSGGRFTKSSRKIKWHRTEQAISEWM